MPAIIDAYVTKDEMCDALLGSVGYPARDAGLLSRNCSGD